MKDSGGGRTLGWRAGHELSFGVDLAINLVGGLWAVLILAALSSGPRRFGQLKDELGVSSNMLAKRLLDLEGNGLVRRAKLPPPALVQVYEVTAWGLAARPALEALGRWALQRPPENGSSRRVAE
jgi:DNA-binding HxlR family transcriptional regulator